MLSRISASTTSTLLLRRTVAKAAATSQGSRCWASTLVVSEPLTESGATPPQTQCSVTAATQLGQDIDLLVVSDTPPTQVPAGVSKVYHVPIGDQLAESVASAIQSVATSKDCNIVVGTSSKFGSTVIPRAAALLDVSPITDCIEIEDPSKYCGSFFDVPLSDFFSGFKKQDHFRFSRFGLRICLFLLILFHPFIAFLFLFYLSNFLRYICTAYVCGECIGKSCIEGDGN